MKKLESAAGKCGIDVLICAGSLCRAGGGEKLPALNPSLKVIYEQDERQPALHGASAGLCGAGRYHSGKSVPLYEIRRGSGEAAEHVSCLKWVRYDI